MKIRIKFNRNEQGEKVEPRAIDRYEIMDRIELLKSQRDQAFVCFLYLSGCRVTEVVRYIQERKLNRTVKQKVEGSDRKESVPAPITERTIKGSPIQKKQIEIFEKKITIKNVRTLKKKQAYIPLRNIPILRTEREEKFLTILFDYLETLQDEDYLFDITRQRAKQIIEKAGLYCHYLRHCRLTHLAVDYGFDNNDLKKFTNWTSSATADNYVHKNVGDLFAKMERNA